MRVQYMSDLHLEMEDMNITNDNGADILILAGDIMCGPLDKRRLTYMSKHWDHTIIVPGNHEYYHGVLSEVDYSYMDNTTQAFKNIHYLNPGYVVIEGHLIVGACLWTNVWDEINRPHISNFMNDYRYIKINYNKKLTLIDTIGINAMHKAYIKEIAVRASIVVTHHAPSMESCASARLNPYLDSRLDSAYCNDMDDLIMDLKPTVWIHGHVHQSVNYMRGSTCVLANPRGYGNENPDFNPQQTVIV